jgi:hypothetical protein
MLNAWERKKVQMDGVLLVKWDGGLQLLLLTAKVLFFSLLRTPRSEERVRSCIANQMDMQTVSRLYRHCLPSSLDL